MSMAQFLLFTFFLNLFNFVSLDCGCLLNREINIQQELNPNEFQNEQCNIQTVGKTESSFKNMVLIPGGTYVIGTNEPVFQIDRESPEKTVTINDFYLDKFEVSNKDFEEFVDATNHVTDAEKFNDSFVFHDQLSAETREKYKDFRVARALWWYKVNGTNWKQPKGPNSDLEDLWDHPVVHVSWKDATSYCAWLGKRLPTESEWEIACRGNKKRKLFPWGNKMNPKDKHWMNIWQGEFPNENTIDDGFEFTCPVNKFRQNDYDIYNIVGNVWEWTSDLWVENDNTENPNRVKKGGSYLCHKSYCYRYRCAARSQNTEDSSASNLGFRCAANFKQ